MGITVKGPNGITINFPDGTDSDTINKVMKQAVGQQSQAPTVAEGVVDAAGQAVRGFNKGLADIVSAPYRALDWSLEQLSGNRIGLPDVDKMPLWQQFRDQPEAKTMAGRIARTAGEGVGASAVPLGATAGLATRAAGPAAQTAIGQIGQQAVQAVRANPMQAAALDVTGAAAAGAGAEVAKESGGGPLAQTAAAIAAGFVPGLALSYGQPMVRALGTTTGRRIAEARLDRARADAESFNRQDVRPFGPAFNEGPVASVGKQLTETPIVGAPLRNNLAETFQETAGARNRLADLMANQATLEEAGLSVQRGLHRFRDRSFDRLTPDVVRGLGIDPDRPVGRQTVGTRAQTDRITRTDPIVREATGGVVQTSRGQDTGLPVTYGERYAPRTRLDDLSDAELGAVIRAPANRTSFSTRSEALYERAWRNMPRLLRRDGSVDPILLPSQNSREIVNFIVRNEARTGVTSGLQGRYGQMFQTLSNPHANVTMATLREMRTAIGRDLSNFGMYDATLDRTQLRNIYAALSRDIEVGFRDMAARTAAAVTGRGNTGTTNDDVRRATQAFRDMQVADRYFRQGMERMDRFLAVVQQPNPQAAAAQLIRAANEGSPGNNRLVRAALSVLNPEERSQFGALIVRTMGGASDGASGQVREFDFSPQRFVTAYTRISPETRNMLFSAEHQRSLDDLFRISRRLQDVEAMANTSRSATNAVNVGAVMGAGGAAAMGLDSVLSFGGGAAALASTSALMSRPNYVRWLTRYMELRLAVRSGRERAIGPMLQHIQGLRRRAIDDPALWPAYYAVSGEDKAKQGKIPEYRITPDG